MASGIQPTSPQRAARQVRIIGMAPGQGARSRHQCSSRKGHVKVSTCRSILHKTEIQPFPTRHHKCRMQAACLQVPLFLFACNCAGYNPRSGVWRELPKAHVLSQCSATGLRKPSCVCIFVCLFAFHTAEPPAALLLYTVCPGLPPSILALNATWNCSATGAGTKCTATGCTNGTIPLPSLPSLYCQLVNNVFTWDTASLTGACAPNPGPRKSLSFISL
jgi:hypothetical protein